MLGNKGSRKFYRTGGTRGGQDQFRWDDVKSDKYRENYLGHSQMAPVGRWQKGKDLFWYNKVQKSESEILKSEIELMKERDENQINVALGLTKKKHNYSSGSLEKDDIKYLLSRGETERSSVDIERIEGLGAAPARLHDHIERGPSMWEKEMTQLRNESASKQQVKEQAIKTLKRNRDSDGSDTSVDAKKHKSSKKHKKEKKSKKHKK
jgi:hypothetical protein